MPQQAQETVNVRTPGGKVIPILKSDLATAIKRGAIPVNVPRETQKVEEEGELKKAGRGAATGVCFRERGCRADQSVVEPKIKILRQAVWVH